MTEYAVHRCRLFDYNPRAVQCMATHKTTQGEKVVHKLAVGREDGSIELIKSLPTGFHTTMVIPGSSKRTIEDLVWCSGRLFSAHLQGDITEYDLAKGTAKYSEDSYGGAVWCLAAANTSSVIAAGCEDGSLKLFSYDTPKLVYERSMDRQEGRILSCCFHPSDERLASGSVDTIRVWSCKSGHAIQSINLEYSKHMGTIVWDVKFLSDHTIVSGDSRGRVQFWNGKNATLIKSFHGHQADILTVCVSEDETAVYASGVDAKVLEINLVAEEQEEKRVVTGIGGALSRLSRAAGKWVKGATLQKHTHDVRSLVIVDKLLVSGGVDTNLLLRNVHDREDRRLRRAVAFPHKPYVHLAETPRMLLLQYSDHLDVWKLAKPTNIEGIVGEEIPIQEPPIKLLQIKRSPQDTDDISCCDISPCGHWVAYSTKSTFKLFRLNWRGDEPMEISITKVRVVWFTPCFAITFTSDSSHMITSSLDGKIFAIKLDADAHVHVAHIFQDESESDLMKPAHTLATYKNDFLAIIDSDNEIKVYDLKKFEMHCTLPARDNPPSAMTFKPGQPHLFVAYQDHEVIEYDVEKKSYTDWCRSVCSVGFNLLHFRRFFHHKTRKRLLNWSAWPVLNVSVSEENPDMVMVTTPLSLYFVKQSKDMTKEAYETGRYDKGKAAVKCVTKLQPVLYATFMEGGRSLLAVERSLTDIFDNLPPTLYQKKFGL